MKEIHVFGAACSAGASTSGCELAPDCLRTALSLKDTKLPLEWKAILHTRHTATGIAAMGAIAEYCENLAILVAKAIKGQHHFLTLGGDHSCAIGTWSGAAHALRDQGPIGLIWIDAHIDAHTPSSTLTGNIHGMPVAHLLGEGASTLNQLLDKDQKIHPEHLVLIGIRSFEEEEQALINQLGVKVFYMEEILQRGIDSVLKEAFDHINRHTKAFGMSIDLDGFDPKDAPGVGTPAGNGIDAQAFIDTYRALQKNNLIGLEIAELNPRLDQDNKSEQLAIDLIAATFDELYP